MKCRAAMGAFACLALAAPIARAQDLVTQPPGAAALDDKNADFRAELTKATEDFVKGAPWGPYWRHANTAYRIYFYQPYETVLSMSRALPYLEPAQRTALIGALDAFVADYPPLTRASVLQQEWGGGPVAALGESGSWRAWAPPPPADGGPGYNFWPAPQVPAFALYAVWAYATYAERKDYVDMVWGDVQQLYSKAKGTPSGTELWASTGAMIGAARLASLHGDAAMAAEAAGFASAGLDAVRAFQAHAQQHDEHRRVQTFSIALTSYDHELASEEPRPISRSIAREVLMAIGNDPTGRSQLAQYIQHYEHRNDYTFGGNPMIVTELVDWSATEHGGFSGSEGGATLPEISWAFFLSHAYALGTNQNTLRPWLDVAWCRADLMQIDKLVAAIEATPGDDAPPPPDYDASPPGTADSGGDAASAPAQGPADSGCGCRATPRSGTLSLAWVLGLLFLARRRAA